MKVSLQKLYEILLEILLIILPVNYMIFNVILVKFYFLKYSKDIIMVLIIMLGALISKKKAQHMLNEHLTFLFYIVFYIFFIILMRVMVSDNIMDSMYAARLLVVPVVFLCTLIINPISKKAKDRIYTKIFLLTTVICIWGIFQAYVLGDSFLIKLNYKGISGRLSSGFYISGYRGIQRVVATFAAPNLFAMYLNFILFFSLFIRQKIHVSNKTFRIGILLFAVTEVLTFSRSGWIGFIIGGCYYIIRKKKVTRMQVVQTISVLAFTTVILGIALSINDDLRDAFVLLISRSFAGEDSSLVMHIQSLTTNIEKVLRNPLGYKWLGYSGPRTRGRVINYNVESSVLLIGLELGILGGLGYAILLFLIYLNGVRTDACNSIRASLISIIPLLLFLPLIYEYELITLIYVSIGISMQSKDRKMIACTNTSR